MLAACDDAPACGPGTLATDAIVATSGADTMTYGEFRAGANNDCPAQDGSTVTSLTIFSAQPGGSGHLNLCIPRPDLLTAGDRTIGLDQVGGDIRIVDFKGSTAGTPGCTYAIDRAQPPTGTGHATGLCDAGTSAAGFALTLSGGATMTRTCGTQVDTVLVTIAGTTSVLPM